MLGTALADQTNKKPINVSWISGRAEKIGVDLNRSPGYQDTMGQSGGVGLVEGLSPMMELHIFNRAGTRLRAFALGDAAEVIIGRDETCDIRIFSQIVSREHASIEREGEDLVLRDLQSTCGTFVRGDRIDQIRLEDGMEISIGPAVLKFFDAEI